MRSADWLLDRTNCLARVLRAASEPRAGDGECRRDRREHRASLTLQRTARLPLARARHLPGGARHGGLLMAVAAPAPRRIGGAGWRSRSQDHRASLIMAAVVSAVEPGAEAVWAGTAGRPIHSPGVEIGSVWGTRRAARVLAIAEIREAAAMVRARLAGCVTQCVKKSLNHAVAGAGACVFTSGRRLGHCMLPRVTPSPVRCTSGSFLRCPGYPARYTSSFSFGPGPALDPR